jgi:hypothetical protein
VHTAADAGILRGTESSHDSPLEEDGFEPSVPQCARIAESAPALGRAALFSVSERLLEWPPSDPIGWSGRKCSAEPPRLGSVGSNSDEASKPLNIGRGTEGSNPALSSGESEADTGPAGPCTRC